MFSKVDFYLFIFFNFLLYQSRLHYPFQTAKNFKKLVQPHAQATTHTSPSWARSSKDKAEHDFSPRMKHIQPWAPRMPEHKTQLHYNAVWE